MTTEDAEGTPGPGAAGPIEVRWADGVATRALGLGGDAVVVAFEGRQDTPAMLLVASRPSHNARLYRPTGQADGLPTYDAGTWLWGWGTVTAACSIAPPGADRMEMIGVDPDLGLVRGRVIEGPEAEGELHPDDLIPGYPRVRWDPLGLPADLGLGSVRVAQLAAFDWDGDGKLDLLVGLDDLADYWPDADLYPSEQLVGFDQGGGHPGYDERGRWRGRMPEGRIAWLRNVTEPGAEAPRFAPPEPIEDDGRPLDVGPRPAPLVVPWGGSGNDEFLLADGRNVAHLFRNFGGIRPPSLAGSRPIQAGGSPLVLPDDRTHLAAADLDGDGRPVLFGGRADGTVFAIRPAPGRDAATPPRTLQQEPGGFWVGGDAVVAAADLDGDGGVDLVVGDGAGHLSWYRNVGSGDPNSLRYEAARRLDAGGDPFRLDPGVDGRLNGPIDPPLGYACPTAVDWTGNGRPDLIVGGAGGEVILLRNDGAATDPRFAWPVGLRAAGRPLITPPRVRPACAPWGPDGVMHLFALDLQGFLVAYPQRDANNLERPVRLADSLGRWIRLDGGFGLAGRVALWAGPWTGPDRVDLIVGLTRLASRFVVPPLTNRFGSYGDPLLLLEDGGPDGYIPRSLRRASGEPMGFSGPCSPSGVPTRADGKLDLLVGSSKGQVQIIRREDLRW